MEAENFDQTLRAFTNRFEVDHPEALLVRDGVAVYIAPGGVPVLFDHQGVAQVIGDLMGQASA